MAVITSAALAGTAITAATIASGVGVAATAATTGMSFVQAGKQKKAMQQAEKDADAAMQEARKKLQVNVYDKLAIQKEPYELQIEGMLSRAKESTTQAIEADPRNLSATAGRVQMAFNEGSDAIRTAMGQDLQQLEMLSAHEDSRLRDIGVQLDLEEVAGAQLAAANAQELQAQAVQQGMAGVTSIGSQLADTAPTFEKTSAARQNQKLSNTLTKDFNLSQPSIQQNIASQGMIDGFDFSKVGVMEPEAFQAFMNTLPAQTLKKLREKSVGGLQKAEIQKSNQMMISAVDRAKQGRANMFSTDFINEDLLNPFRR